MDDSDRRNQDRVPLDPPGVGVLRLLETPADPAEAIVFVDVHNQGPGGVLIETAGALPDPETCSLQFFDRQADAWRVLSCRRVWEAGRGGGGLLWGLSFETGPRAVGDLGAGPGVLAIEPGDIDFLLRIRLLDSVPRSGICRLLNSLRRETHPRGTRLMDQGEKGDSLYVIQDGVCRVEVEKDGGVHPVAELRSGDVVGEMGVLTGEPRTARAVAATDVVLWRLGRDDFESLAVEQPGIRVFLTGLVANRFESSQVTADRTVAKYVISKKLGKGQWSIVYRGRHRALGMPVAVKMLRHDLAMHPRFLRSFRREASVIAALRHPNIVQVFDVEEAYSTVFIVMECLEGFSLREVMDRAGRMPAERAAEILRQVCSGLAYAHERGVVHRDVSPANVFVQEGGRVKILDFGVALGPDDAAPEVRGTPYYEPPEAAGARAADPRMDMYSVGLMAYEMVVGERPFMAPSRDELMLLRRARDIPDPADAVPGLPEALRAFIRTCCRRDPAERYADMAEAEAALAPLARDEVRMGRRMTSLRLFYPDEAQDGVRELLEEVAARARDMGAELRGVEGEDA